MSRKRFLLNNLGFILIGLFLYVLILNVPFTTIWSLLMAEVGSMFLFVGSYSLLAGMRERKE